MPTLKDVARRANVSKSTVSRAFNDPDRVKPETLTAIRKAARELNYKPSRVARRLRMDKGRTNMIGLVIPDIQNPFFADVTRGVEDVARGHDYTLILSNSDEDPAKQKLALDTLRAESVDGVIVPPVRDDDPDVEALVESGIPVVCVDRRLASTRVDMVISDNERGSRMATEHLIEQGHRRIAYIGGIPRISTSRERLSGYRNALKEHNLPFDDALVRDGDSRQESGQRLTEQLLNLDPPPTALVAGNNLMMLGALIALNEHNVRIPQDMALVGYDDVPWAKALNPPPTVVNQPGYEMGRRAAETLFQRFAEPNQSTTLATLQPTLVVRASCGATS